jgi:hypothetical protein
VSEDQPRRPVLRVVSGSPTAEDLAVLTAVIAATSAAPAEDSAGGRDRRGRWNDPAAAHRRAVLAGPNGWRAAAR